MLSKEIRQMICKLPYGKIISKIGRKSHIEEAFSV